MVRTTRTVEFAEFAWCGQEMYHNSNVVSILDQGAGEKQGFEGIELFRAAPAPHDRPLTAVGLISYRCAGHTSRIEAVGRAIFGAVTSANPDAFHPAYEHDREVWEGAAKSAMAVYSHLHRQMRRLGTAASLR